MKRRGASKEAERIKVIDPLNLIQIILAEGEK